MDELIGGIVSLSRGGMTGRATDEDEGEEKAGLPGVESGKRRGLVSLMSRIETARHGPERAWGGPIGERQGVNWRHDDGC